VLDGIGKELLLDEPAMEASRAVLQDYGNVSSSTTWYTLGYVESVRGAKKGDRLLQIGVGSGIKCGVNVWRAVRDIHDVQVGTPRACLRDTFKQYLLYGKHKYKIHSQHTSRTPYVTHMRKQERYLACVSLQNNTHLIRSFSWLTQ
jgi:hypothetical protein